MRRRIPNSHRAIHAATRQALSVGAKGHATDTEEARPKRGQRLARAWLPNRDRTPRKTVATHPTADCELLAIGTERHGENPVILLWESEQFLPCSDIPHLHPTICATAREPGTI